MCRVALLSLLLIGCSKDDDDDDRGGPDGGVERTIELGEGDEEGQGCTLFADGDDAHLRYGSQGGFHVFVAAQVTGFEERRLVFDMRAYRDDLPDEENPANQMQRLLDLEPLGPDGRLVTSQAERLILCPHPGGIGSVDKPYRIWVSVRDSLGRTATTDIDVRTVCPPGDDRCPPTCAGE